jgi:hypothetical protein
MDYGIWQGAERATGNALATGMKLMDFQAQRAHQQAVEANQAEQLKIQKATANIAIDEAKKKQAAYDRKIDINTHPAFLSMPEEERPKVLKFFADNGMTDENGIGTAGKLTEGIKMIGSSAPLFDQFMKPVIRKHQTDAMTAWTEYQTAQQTGDPKKTQIALEKFNQINGNYYGSLGKFEEHMKTLTEQEGKERLERIKNEGKDAIETWGPEEQGKGGTTIQKSSRGQIRTVFKPLTDKNAPESRVGYRDTVTGAINYYDKNNPKDREIMQKYGKQLQPVMENPLAPVMREGVSSTAGKSAYKSAEEVKAAYEAKKITKDEAANILRKDFGMQ